MAADLRLDWCSHRAAAYACQAWHYSRSMPTPPTVRLGVWEAGAFVGAVVFSRGVSRHLGRPFGLATTEVAELARVALRAHVAPVSRILAIAIRMLRRHAPGLRLLVSFADVEQGHHGGIYQAAGWTYLGTSDPSHVFVDARGRRWHPRMVSASGVKRVYGAPRRVVRIDECTRLDVSGKHRYALALDPALRPMLAGMAQPYPTRPKEQAPASPAGLDGATPIRPLTLHQPSGGSHV